MKWCPYLLGERDRCIKCSDGCKHPHKGFPEDKLIIRVSFLFAWYDLWIGLFWDKKKKWLYILPLPCLGIILKFKN